MGQIRLGVQLVVLLRWVNTQSFVLGADMPLQGGFCAVKLIAVLMRAVVPDDQVFGASSLALRGQEKTLLLRSAYRLEQLQHHALLVLCFFNHPIQVFLALVQFSVLSVAVFFLLGKRDEVGVMVGSQDFPVAREIKVVCFDGKSLIVGGHSQCKKLQSLNSFSHLLLPLISGENFYCRQHSQRERWVWNIGKWEKIGRFGKEKSGLERMAVQQNYCLCQNRKYFISQLKRCTNKCNSTDSMRCRQKLIEYPRFGAPRITEILSLPKFHLISQQYLFLMQKFCKQRNKLSKTASFPQSIQKHCPQFPSQPIQQIMEDNQSQSYDQSKIDALRREVEVSKSQLIKLAYNDQKLLEKIDELNRRGAECISQQQFYEAIVFLNEAENVLQYAAECGRTIDSTLIIETLHNQACVYQRIWELNKSMDYLEAIIYNISSFLQGEAQFAFTPDIANPLSPQHHKLAAYLGSKLQLISYNLQYCAVSSQVKNHDSALKSAQKSLTWLKGFCEEITAYERLVGGRATSDFQKTLLQDIQNIRNFQNENLEETQKNIEKLMYKAKKSITVFQKKLESPSSGLRVEEKKELQNFSLGQVMQVSPISIKKMQERLNINEELTLLKKIYKAIYVSIGHFTMATELRLIANERHGVQSSIRRLSKEFKESQVHHLVAIITVALYVPCYTKYFEHILNSFKNHYQIDLTQMSELSQNNEGVFVDDLIHLQIQSVSQRDSDLAVQKQSSSRNANYSKDMTRQSQRMGVSFQKEASGHKTVDIQGTGSSESSQNQYLKIQNRTIRSSDKKDIKRKGEKGKKKVTEQTSRQKQTLIMEKITSKSRSKGKRQSPDTKRSKSRKSVRHVEQKQKVVHYFHYDNYSKKVVKKKMKVGGKDTGEYELTKKNTRPVRDKKSPQALINNHLKKLNQLSQSTKQLIASELAPKMMKKGKSPELSTSRSQRYHLKNLS